MRFIKAVTSEEEADGCLALLAQSGIEARAEAKDEGFEIWVLSEDHYSEAQVLFSSAEKPPSKLKQLRIIARRSMADTSWVATKVLILLCIALFALQWMQSKQEGPAQRMGLVPIMLATLYDYPQPFEQLYDYLEHHPNVKVKDAKKVVKGPYWKGVYDILLHYPKEEKAPLFEKIKQGEVYRLITPAVLHGGILHILFNMLWLWLLGKQVEHRIGIVRYLSLSLLLGVITNTAQYFMSGFLFLGYSGIIAGLAGFIWMRQKIAPWDGYSVPRATLIFFALFIFGMALLSLATFIFARFDIMRLPSFLGNTAHVVGAIFGALFARVPLFARRHH